MQFSSGNVTVCANGRGQADAEARSKAAAGAWARARSWLQSGAGGALSGALMVGCGLAAYELLLRRGAARLGAGAPHGPGDLGLGSGLAADGGMAVGGSHGAAHVEPLPEALRRGGASPWLKPHASLVCQRVASGLK